MAAAVAGVLAAAGPIAVAGARAVAGALAVAGARYFFFAFSSNRSASITLVHAAAKSFANFSFASSEA